MIAEKLISIKSVLLDIVSFLPEEQIDEFVLLNDLGIGLRTVNSSNILEHRTAFLAVKNHRACMPKEYVSLIQLAYCTDTKKTINDFIGESFDVNSKDSDIWTAMISSSDSFQSHTDIRDFSLDGNGIITTSFKEGLIAASYYAYPMCEGYHSIPDDDDLKRALLHYVLHRFFARKTVMEKDKYYVEMMQYHLSQYQLLKTKYAGKTPPIGVLENLVKQRNALLTGNAYHSLFNNLNRNNGIVI